MKPPEQFRDLVDRPLFAAFATARASGAPQAHVMWFMWDDAAERVRLTHTKTRQMYQFIQKEPRVALLVMDPDNGYRYMQIRGVVESIEDDPEGKFYQQLMVRYRGSASPVADANVRVIMTIRPTVFVARQAGSQPVVVGEEKQG
ncbi:MAG: PPOX class F420-dependent oxidoreductase [Chloroflexi bacterium]|nr:PPOX class F420-dependent oxidoreductase [Chloroflexota bacterium]